MNCIFSCLNSQESEVESVKQKDIVSLPTEKKENVLVEEFVYRRVSYSFTPQWTGKNMSQEAAVSRMYSIIADYCASPTDNVALEFYSQKNVPTSKRVDDFMCRVAERTKSLVIEDPIHPKHDHLKFEAIKKFRYLEELTLNSLYYKDEHLLQLSCFERLQVLKLKKLTRLTHVGIQHIQDLTTLRKIVLTETFTICPLREMKDGSRERRITVDALLACELLFAKIKGLEVIRFEPYFKVIRRGYEDDEDVIVDDTSKWHVVASLSKSGPVLPKIKLQTPHARSYSLFSFFPPPLPICSELESARKKMEKMAITDVSVKK